MRRRFRPVIPRRIHGLFLYQAGHDDEDVEEEDEEVDDEDDDCGVEDAVT